MSNDEHDAREVAALGLALYNVAWTMNPPMLDWGTSKASKAAWERAATFVLDREAALVTALEDAGVRLNYLGDVVSAPRVWAALAAHRLVKKPPEPTLAEAAELLLSDTTMRGTDTFYGVRHELDALRAALAREQAKGGK